jgi:hypothetical protein
MKHADYNNGFIAHNVEERLGLPCGSVAIASESEDGPLYALVEFNGRGNGQTVVAVTEQDQRYGLTYEEITK